MPWHSMVDYRGIRWHNVVVLFCTVATLWLWMVYDRYSSQGVKYKYHSGKNNYRCKSLINSKTISAGKKITEIIFARLMNSKNIMSA